MGQSENHFKLRICNYNHELKDRLCPLGKIVSGWSGFLPDRSLRLTLGVVHLDGTEKIVYQTWAYAVPSLYLLGLPDGDLVASNMGLCKPMTAVLVAYLQLYEEAKPEQIIKLPTITMPGYDDPVRSRSIAPEGFTYVEEVTITVKGIKVPLFAANLSVCGEWFKMAEQLFNRPTLMLAGGKELPLLNRTGFWYPDVRYRFAEATFGRWNLGDEGNVTVTAS